MASMSSYGEARPDVLINPLIPSIPVVSGLRQKGSVAVWPSLCVKQTPAGRDWLGTAILSSRSPGPPCCFPLSLSPDLSRGQRGFYSTFQASQFPSLVPLGSVCFHRKESTTFSCALWLLNHDCSWHNRVKSDKVSRYNCPFSTEPVCYNFLTESKSTDSNYSQSAKDNSSLFFFKKRKINLGAFPSKVREYIRWYFYLKHI